MPPQVQALTPQQAAQQVLARVGKTTAVSVASNVSVAGQAAYELVLAPKDSRSLVGQVVIAIDGSNGVPLRLQVFARGASTPAFQVGYTSIQFVTPAPAELTFTPPPGAKISHVSTNGGDTGASTGQAGSGHQHDRLRLARRARAALRRPDAGTGAVRLGRPGLGQRRGR